ncbi:hypothetical protein J1P26_19445 [Neobacillus sp. MM2021_6]|uniref:hypothetical protein n=1 Tax=Bacillaceae TaxID=186817 RepID=UPI001409522F|nr:MULTISPECIES: hypothetical protein [Bacillaceae]MBO0961883.1 hypothetical protein [Neobacillus sp. MM2021_6]NHC18950.1 hypothetical protein [Bacillus sp. MM2020_4]
MRISDLQPKKNLSYIFVQFPGMKMNLPMLSSDKEKVVKEEVALCVQVNRNKKVDQLYFVRTQSIKPFDFTDGGSGAKASYRVIKPKEDSQVKAPLDFVTVITDEVEIVQKITKTGYHFILMVNKREIGIVASIELEVLQTEKEAVQQKEKMTDNVTVTSINKKNRTVFGRNAKKKIFWGGKIFEDIVANKPIRILLEGGKRTVTVFSPAALDFLGPGDRNHSIFNMGGVNEICP